MELLVSNIFSNSHGKESSKYNHKKIPKLRMPKISTKKYCISPFYVPAEPKNFVDSGNRQKKIKLPNPL